MTSAIESHPPYPPVPVPPPPVEPPAAARATPRWSLPALLAVLALAAVLYAWNLSSGGLNSFYSAAVYSGTQSWKAWFFGSIDAGNFLTVDKPPLALMVMSLSCRIFGFGTWQMMLPQIGAGLGTIWILHASVKRVWGHAAAAVAALVLALTPITVAIDRDNNPDTILLLLMVGGAALALRATRDGRLLPLLASAACFGLAFNTKMLQGYIALPAVFAVYVYASGLGWGRKIRNLVLATVVLAVSSFWWATAVSMIPADERPYIGGSTDGTAWNLIFGYNGFGRILGGEGNGGGGGGGGGATFAGSAGLGRLFNDVLGGQISWLIPFAAIALVGGLVLCGRAPRTDMTRAGLVLWGGWLVLHYVTFATAEGTMHPYYTTAVAPGVAALCGGGGVMLLRAFRTDKRWAWVLPVALGVTGLWAVVLLRRASGWNSWLWPTVALLMAAAVAGLLVFRMVSGRRPRLLAVSVTAALVAGLAGPAAYAWSEPLSSGTGGGMGGTNPTAGPTTGNGMGGPGGGRGGFPGGRRGELAGGGETAGGGQMPGGGETPGGSGGTPGGGQRSGGSGMPGGGQRSGGGEMPGGGQEGLRNGEGQGGGRLGGGGPMGGAVDSDMIAYLEKHQDGAEWLLAVSNSQSAARLVLSTKKPVISMYGFTGSDKGMTVAKLKKLVKSGQLHYIQVGGSGMGGGGPMGGGNDVSSAVTAWVKAHGTKVKASEYSKSGSSSASSSSSTSSSLYRLDPSDVE
ncbi:mannosyltransferase YkcB-related protein [Streptomyces beihaiensis]|uniref:Glycosyltransferase family 39 protein n=1 Tax=Streptomyces beihaiensis TaxID=2984495 RepID=A0ABT3TPY5_9ACTN|nr:glycosyltransferase family 39 protein [Streptomyces beihaiensis]MCX3058512.1 glycosyltransferase family 39 protein [Streptomyces beihaiensis]